MTPDTVIPDNCPLCRQTGGLVRMPMITPEVFHPEETQPFRLDVTVSAAFSWDSQLLATADGSPDIRVWDRNTGKERGILHSRHGPVTSLAFTSSENIVLAATGKFVTAWNLTRGTMQDIYREHDGATGTLSAAPDGETPRHRRTRSTCGDPRVACRRWQGPLSFLNGRDANQSRLFAR